MSTCSASQDTGASRLSRSRSSCAEACVWVWAEVTSRATRLPIATWMSGKSAVRRAMARSQRSERSSAWRWARARLACASCSRRSISSRSNAIHCCETAGSMVRSSRRRSGSASCAELPYSPPTCSSTRTSAWVSMRRRAMGSSLVSNDAAVQYCSEYHATASGRRNASRGQETRRVLSRHWSSTRRLAGSGSMVPFERSRGGLQLN